jgi:energy-coupling factor transporter ATP-binding protein EcfA2
MNLSIAYCNNIDTGAMAIEEGRLNIKYAMNGTGKSTVARAIELLLRGDGSLKELTPFKLLDASEGVHAPQVEGLAGVSSCAVFNDAYVNQFAFKPDEVLANSFEVFVRSPDYDSHLGEIEALTADIRSTFKESQEIDQVISELSTLSESFGKSKSGFSAAGALAKGIGKGNKIANIPKGLESYTAYLQSSVNSKWLRWQMDGNTYVELSDNCPYCTSPTAEKKETIAKVSQEYDAKAVEHLNRIVTVLDSLGRYFSDDASAKLKAIACNVEGLSKEERSYLLRIKEQIDVLRGKMLDLRGMTYFSLKDSTKVSEALSALRIDLDYLLELDSPNTRELVEKINTALDRVLGKVGKLQGEVAQQTAVISRTIETNRSGINEFLKCAGYKYHVDAEYVEQTYKMRLRHLDSTQAVNSGSQHLSYGEKNAFALVLFMYECLSKQPNIIVLDDPISSFDRNKKYAVIDMLFRGKRSLRGKTVLMMTHDLEPIIDILYNLPHKFDPLPIASFMWSRQGVLQEKEIKRADLRTFGSICDENIESATEDVVKVTYLRRYYEILDNKGMAYQLLSNLLHKRAAPFKKEGGVDIPLTEEEIKQATEKIRMKMPSFDYQGILSRVADAALLKDAFLLSTHSYEKLQLFRLLQDQVEPNDVVQKFINETYHIENEYVMQINPCTYDIVPEFILEECKRLVNTI